MMVVLLDCGVFVSSGEDGAGFGSVVGMSSFSFSWGDFGFREEDEKRRSPVLGRFRGGREDIFWWCFGVWGLWVVGCEGLKAV